eukprot:scaffold37499_cov260-Amphora_coffeaeformis.AAC.1
MTRSSSLSLVVLAVIAGGHGMDAFQQPVIPDLQPFIKDAMDRLGQPRSLDSTITTDAAPPPSSSSHRNIVMSDNHKKPSLDDLFQRSSAWATETSTRLVRGVTWLATHEDSPAIPMAAATQQFVKHGVGEAQSHWKTHGDDYQQVLKETTESAHRNILSWGQTAWETFETLSSHESFLPLKDAHDLVEQFQTNDQKPETPEHVKHLYFLSDVEPELATEATGVNSNGSSKTKAIKGEIQSKAQKAFSFFMAHGKLSQQKLHETTESIGQDVVNWGRKLSKKNKKRRLL